MFDKNIIPYLQEALNGPLPGTEAHNKMISYNRKTAKEVRERNVNYKLSAVLMLLFPKFNELHFTLIQRPPYDGTHGGQISFPGGGVEKSDHNLESTAKRETLEEIGIPQNSINIIGTLSSLYIPPSNYLVHPFMGFHDSQPDYKLDPTEVASILEVPLIDLLKPDKLQERIVHIQSMNAKLKVKAFIFEGHVVWGATAMMLAEVREILLKA